MALGELELTIEQFGEYTIGQINALMTGYMRRRDALEDLFIVYSALPTYQSQLGRKAPSYRRLTAHRRRRNSFNRQLPDKEVQYWKQIIKEAKQHAEIPCVQTGNGQPAGTD